MTRSVFGIAKSESQASLIVDEFKSAGFSTNDISVLFPDKRGTKDFAHEKHTKAPEGATTGGLTGGIVGGTLGLLAGIGALAIPGLGPFIAAGPLMAALSGAAVGGAVGGLVGFLVGLGIPEYEAKRYVERVKSGSILIAVSAETHERREKAEKIFERAGAEDISSTGDEKSAAHSSRKDFKNDKSHPNDSRTDNTNRY